MNFEASVYEQKDSSLRDLRKDLLLLYTTDIHLFKKKHLRELGKTEQTTKFVKQQMRSEDYVQRSTNNWDESSDTLFHVTSVIWI